VLEVLERVVVRLLLLVMELVDRLQQVYVFHQLVEEKEKVGPAVVELVDPVEVQEVVALVELEILLM
tara:strand:- start:420 stop:620 length:201 start_codon:yes stop_codon:yes gene_type:complete